MKPAKQPLYKYYTNYSKLQSLFVKLLSYSIPSQNIAKRCSFMCISKSFVPAAKYRQIAVSVIARVVIIIVFIYRIYPHTFIK